MPKALELKLAKIGNSHGIRLPVNWIRRHSLEDGVILEERGDELILRPRKTPGKLSWTETAREIAAANEDWSEWDGVSADGLESASWEPAASAKPVSKPSRKP